MIAEKTNQTFIITSKKQLQGWKTREIAKGWLTMKTQDDSHAGGHRREDGAPEPPAHTLSRLG